jgi:hypothetical protein
LIDFIGRDIRKQNGIESIDPYGAFRPSKTLCKDLDFGSWSNEPVHFGKQALYIAYGSFLLRAQVGKKANCKQWNNFKFHGFVF